MAGYPTGTEFVAYCSAEGLGTLTTQQGDDLIEQAIREFEQRTGRSPFISTAGTGVFESQTSGSVDGYWIPLRSNTILAAVPANDVVVTSIDLSGVSKELVYRSDFDLLPLGGGGNEKPFDFLRLRSMPDAGRIEIEAPFGYCEDCPADVRQCLYDLAFWIMAKRKARASALTAEGQIVTKEKAGPVEYSYGAAKADDLIDDALRVIARYSI